MRNLCGALDIQMDLLRSVKAPTLPEDAFTPILLNCSTQRISLTANRRLACLRLLASRAIKPEGLVSRCKSRFRIPLPFCKVSRKSNLRKSDPKRSYPDFVRSCIIAIFSVQQAPVLASCPRLICRRSAHTFGDRNKIQSFPRGRHVDGCKLRNADGFSLPINDGAFSSAL